jgi:serine protease Do
MTTRSVVAQVTITILGSIVACVAIIRSDIVGKLGYQWEKGRITAYRQVIDAGPDVSETSRVNRAVAEVALPATVYIETRRPMPNEPEDGAESLMEIHAPEGIGHEQLRDWLRQHQSRPEFENTPDRFGDKSHRPTGRYFEQGIGSGFVVDAKKGYVVTNHHVVDGADQIKVFLSDGRRMPAELLGIDPATDLAILAIEPVRLHELAFGNSDVVDVGDEVFAVGSPFRLRGTFSRGIISAKDRSQVIEVNGIQYEGFLQTDAVINPGNSGGPLVNTRGEVIGVNTAIATSSGRYQGVGFAIPSWRAANVMHMIIEHGSVIRGWLGVHIGSVNDTRYRAGADERNWTEPYGVLILSFPDDEMSTPAKLAGIREGDVLVELNGRRLSGATELMDRIAATTPGDTVMLKTWRDDGFLSIPVVVGKRPDES